MKKVIFILIIVLISSVILMGNKNQTEEIIVSDEIVLNTKEKLYNNDLDITELKVSDINNNRIKYPNEIENIFASTISLQSIRSEVNDLILRYNKGVYYGVAKIKTTNDNIAYLFMLFDKQLNFIDGMVVQKLSNKKDFANIEMEVTTLEDICKIAPGTELYDFCGGNGEKTAVSFHRFLDGTMLVINYTKTDRPWIVNNVVLREDPTNFLSYILEKDLEVIKDDDENVSNETPYFYVNSVMKDVIENKQEFYSTESSRKFYLKDFRYREYLSSNNEGIGEYTYSNYDEFYDKSDCEILSFCVTDLDEDGIPEALFQLEKSEILVLHYEDGLVYGYVFPFRGMANIKTDTTFVGSGGAGYVDVNKIRFSKDKVSFIEVSVLNGIDNIYRINGENVTMEEVQAFLDIQYEKQNVEWYDYNDDNLSHFLVA